MGRAFNIYKVSLDFFYQQVLGSKNQAFIDQAVDYLQRDLGLWDEFLQEVISELYQFQLNQLVNIGQFEGETFPWNNFSYQEEKPGENKELELVTKIDTIEALFALDSSFCGFGGYNSWRYWNLFENIQKVVPQADQEVELWDFLLEGRPLPGDRSFIRQDGYSYYTYLTNAELKRLYKSIELLQSPEGIAKLKEIPQRIFRYGIINYIFFGEIT